MQMSFRDNLQHLRATRRMTQEQLAMMLGVSRQSVTKWEAEKAYPEMDKLLKICQIFDCTLDDLVQGDLTDRATEPSLALPADSGASDTIGYVERFEQHALRMGIGVACFIAGCGVGMLVSVALGELTTLPEPENVIAILWLLFVVAGLAIVVPESARHDRFMKEHPFVIDFFTSADRDRIGERSMREIVMGIAVIIVGVVISLAGSYSSVPELLPGGVMIILAAAGVGCIVHGSITNSMCKLEEYNFEALCKLSEAETDQLLDGYDSERRNYYQRIRRVDKLMGIICSIIMMVATITAFLLLFLGYKNTFWVAWPIGGLCCGIIGIIGSSLKRWS